MAEDVDEVEDPDEDHAEEEGVEDPDGGGLVADEDDEDEEDDGHLYRMTLSLSVLDHLGLNLYSNIPAVLSEVVANAWDACATLVEITIDTANRQILITDNGDGMTRKNVNGRFLKVGFQRREKLPTTNRLGRHVMGRKGIGKLSLFAIADTIRIESTKEGERNGLFLRTKAIRQAIADNETYHPDSIDEADLTVEKGTRIELTDLKMKPTAGTEHYLRRRLARRFSIIRPEDNFEVRLNGDAVTPSDREYYDKVEYLWTIGEDKVSALCTNARRVKTLSPTVGVESGWTISGWIGTVDEQRSLGEEGNALPILAWGKIAHEDILPDVGNAKVFSKYIVGEIHANFLDADKEADIATSSRQSFKEIDERFVALKGHLTGLLNNIGSVWTELRNEDAETKARTNPVIDEWFRTLKGDARASARKLFGKMHTLPVEDEKDRLELYKHGILAFERLRFRELLSEIDTWDDSVNLDAIGRLFSNIDDIEAVHYGEVARGRLSVIEKFKGLVDADAREKVIQDHIFDHLWLLHPSWERASTNQRIEERVTTEFDKITAKLTPEEAAGRFDIRYKTAAGKHIIVELKRYKRRVTTAELYAQLSKYRSALRKVLSENFPDQPQAIESVIVIGRMPDDVEPEESTATLRAINARIITYDTLIDEGLASYGDYLEANQGVTRIAQLIRRLDESLAAESA